MNDLKLIKRHYGENMMHLCRELFPTLLETPGLLFKTLSSCYAYNKFLYDDIMQDDYISTFKDYIYSKADQERVKMLKTNKTPNELLDEVGYILYECKTEEDIQKFKKYFAPKEELCTFQGGRLDNCHVFFAVKKNVDEIKRKNFIGKEERQDEYGTSVISIQFSKGESNTLSIKNRYNHTVVNPDATFSNNLDNIIPGLTQAFDEAYGLNINSTGARRELVANKLENGMLYEGGYILANDGKYYKYNYEKNNIYYCVNNVIIDNFEVKKYDPSRYIVFDYFILDMQEKTITQYEDWRKYERHKYILDNDSFLDGFKDIKDIKVVNNREENTKEVIINGDIVISLNKRNQISKYKNHHITELHNNFLISCFALKELDIPNVETIGDNFLFSDSTISELYLPKVRIIGDCFVCSNSAILNLELPEVIKIGDCFMDMNDEIKEIYLPKVKKIGNQFINDGEELRKIYVPKLKEIGEQFLLLNKNLEEIDLPEVVTIGIDFIARRNKILKRINVPKLKSVEAFFLRCNEDLEEIDLPEVEEIHFGTLQENKKLKRINIPKCIKIESNVLMKNEELEEIDMPEAVIIGSSILEYNTKLKRINAPKLTDGPYGQSIFQEIIRENIKRRLLEESSEDGIGGSFRR